MSQKSKIRHAKRDAQQEQQAKKVVRWIFGAFVALAISSRDIFLPREQR